MRILEAYYTVEGDASIQSFSVPRSVLNYGIDFDVITIEVVSNWGHEDFTCLYRVRVHGIERKSKYPLHPK
jgi:SUN domain-containing protein 1/2